MPTLAAGDLTDPFRPWWALAGAAFPRPQASLLTPPTPIDHHVAMRYLGSGVSFSGLRFRREQLRTVGCLKQGKGGANQPNWSVRLPRQDPIPQL